MADSRKPYFLKVIAESVKKLSDKSEIDERTFFAGCALIGLITTSKREDCSDLIDIVNGSWEIADCMVSGKGSALSFQDVHNILELRKELSEVKKDVQK